MRLVVYALSILLVLAGAILVATGAPIVHLEEGWTEILSGSTFMAAGFVIFVLGVFLDRIDRLQHTLAGLSFAPAMAPAQSAPPAFPAAALAFPTAVAAVSAPTPANDPEASEEERHVTAAPEPVLTATPPVSRPEPVIEPLLVEEAPSADVQPEPPLAAFEEEAPSAERADAPHLEPEDLEEQPVSAPPVISPTAAPSRTGERLSPSGVEASGRKRSNFLSSFLARRAATAESTEARVREEAEPPIEPRLMPLHGEVPPPPPRTSIDLSSGWAEPEQPAGVLADEPTAHPQPSEPEQEHAPAWAYEDSAEPEPHREPIAEAEYVEPATQSEPPEAAEEPPPEEPASVEPHPLRPTIVGRYNAGSASYVMYSNGMIEVETDTGIHQFESMQELKAFIEQQDAARV